MNSFVTCFLAVVLVLGSWSRADAQIVYSRWAEPRKPKAAPRKGKNEARKARPTKGNKRAEGNKKGRGNKKGKNEANGTGKQKTAPGSGQDKPGRTKPEEAKDQGKQNNAEAGKPSPGEQRAQPASHQPKTRPPSRAGTRKPQGRPRAGQRPGGAPRPVPTQSPRPNPRPRPRPHPETGASATGQNHRAPDKPMRVLKVMVLGNKKTSDETIIAFSEVRKGDLITAEYLDKVRKRLVNTKLFRKVEVLWEASNKPGWAYLYLNCKDRWSWFIAPMFMYQKGHWGGAIAYGEGNLLGLGKRIGVVARWLTDSQALAVGYQDPGMFGTHLVLKAGLGFERKLLKEYARILGPVMRNAQPVRTLWTNQLFATLGLGYKWLGHLNTSMEYRFGMVALYDPKCTGQQVDATEPNDGCAAPWEEFGGAYSSPIAFKQSDGTWKGSTYGGPKFWKWKRESILRFQVGYDATLDLFGVKQGWKVEARLDISDPHLGSEFSYVHWHIYGYKAFRFFKAHVLEISGKHEESYGAPFHRENYMGGSSLPGYVYRQALGDTNTALRVAYTVPLFHVWWLYFRQVFYYKFAWIFFRDGGKKEPYYTEHAGIRRYHLAFEPGPKDRASFLESVGTGLRMYAKAVAMPLLGVDVAYGFEANAVRVLFYLGKNY